MIIDTIAVENFGVYSGRQELVLTPQSSERPVTLVGGLNGRGKTTLLDAVQLCLYGKFSDCSNRGSLAYSDYLQQSSHTHNGSDTSAVEMQFRRTIDGKDLHYQIRREWSLSEKEPSERFGVSLNGAHDPFLSENWIEAVEEIFPRRVAEFFFFDGERIKSYASPENAANLIRTGLVNLLGIDLVDQLSADLNILKSRKSREIPDDKSRKAFEEAQSELEGLLAERKSVLNDITQLKSHKLRSLEKDLEKVEIEFSHSGGDLFDRTTEIENQIHATEAEHKALAKEASQLAYSGFPLLLVEPLLSDIEKQGKKEISAELNDTLLLTLEERDQALLKAVKKHGSNSKVLEAVKSFLDSDVKKRRDQSKTSKYLGVNQTALATVSSLLSSGLAEKVSSANDILARLDILSRRQSKLSAEKASIPSKDVIGELIERRNALKSEIMALEKEVSKLEERKGKLDFHIERKRNAFERLAKEKVSDEVSLEDATRTIDHSNKVQKTLSALRQRVIAKHIERIEALISESFQHLIAKRGLFKTVKISEDDFSIQLLDHKELPIPPERLSAGERQLFAVSILWGLAKAAGRQLPAIIDTPLGRLDSEHRETLVTRYFPSASHQVLLLSTDEEIEDEYLEMIEPFIARSYVLEYNDESKSTQILQGYFTGRLENAA